MCRDTTEEATTTPHRCTRPTRSRTTTRPGPTRPVTTLRDTAAPTTGDPADHAVRAAGQLGGQRPGGKGAARPLSRRLARRLVFVGLLATALVALVASPAYAAGGGTQTLSGLISNLTTWIVGILAGIATLFLTIGGLRYLTAGGDPGQVEKAKTALKSAAVGYALAILAPLIVSILASLVGGG